MSRAIMTAVRDPARQLDVLRLWLAGDCQALGREGRPAVQDDAESWCRVEVAVGDSLLDIYRRRVAYDRRRHAVPSPHDPVSLAQPGLSRPHP